MCEAPYGCHFDYFRIHFARMKTYLVYATGLRVRVQKTIHHLFSSSTAREDPDLIDEWHVFQRRARDPAANVWTKKEKKTWNVI